MKQIPLVLLLIINTTCLAQRSRTALVDSLKHAFNTSDVDTTKSNILRQIYYNLRQLSPDSALIYLEEALALAEKNGYPILKTTSLYNIGYHHAAIKADSKTAFQYYIEALKLAEQSKDHVNMASCLNGMGSIYYLQGQFSKALEAYKKVAESYKARKADRLLAFAYSSIADTYLNLNNYDEAFSTLKQGLEIAEGLKDEGPKARLYMVMSSALQGMGKIPQANDYSSRATEIFCRLGNNQYCSFCLTQQAEQKLMLGETRESLYLAHKALDVCEKYGLELERMSAFAVLDKIHYQMNDFERAYFYKDKYIKMRDSSLNQTKSAEIANIEAKYFQDKRDAIAEMELQRQQVIRNGLILGFVAMLLFATVFFLQRNRISTEKKRSDSLLLNILPAETAEELKATGVAQARYFDSVTVMFTDFKNFTQASENLSAEVLVKEIHYLFSAFDRIISRHNMEKIKTIGDSYMCAAGLPTPNDTHARDALLAALEIRDFILLEKQARQKEGRTFFDIRIGLHTGPVVAGVVGLDKFAYDIWGDTVNIAARMETASEANRINISSATLEQVAASFVFESRGKIEAKHKGMIEMYFVEGLR